VQAERFEVLAPRYSLLSAGPLIDWVTVFGEAGPVVLDVGFGYGSALIELALARPRERVVGVEVHTPGVAWVLEAIEQHGLTNVRVVHDDVLDFLPRVPAASLDEIRVWFPDPWPKIRQRQRRLVQRDTIALLAERLVPGGVIHLATDVADYAEQMRRVADAEPLLSGGVVSRPDWRPITPFERKGVHAGRVAVDLAYHRIGDMISP
jgi:tRNA (guanine-N7-)-methyltransferase